MDAQDLEAAPDADVDEPTVEVRRNGRLLAAVGVVAAALAIAYLRRATTSGAALDWTLTALLGGIAIAHLVGLVDSRLPLLVADGTGARIRTGRGWTGVPWSDVESVEVVLPAALWRDGRLTLVTRDAAGDRADLAVSLGLATHVNVPADEVQDRLARLAGAREGSRWDALEVDAVSLDDPGPPPEEAAAHPRLRRWRDPRPVVAHGIGSLAARLRPSGPDPEPTASPATAAATAPRPVVASVTPAPLREPRSGQRVDVALAPGGPAGQTQGALALDPTADEVTVVLPEVAELRRPEATDDLGGWVAPGAAPSVAAVDESTPDPVIGPQLAAARRRLSLGVDELAERTRIRPHVIEAIEVDDFAVCGGDFYARGHLRTLARVLGVEAAPLIAAYDELYSHAPVSPRRIFEAELATGGRGSLRGTRGGPNWSVLVAAAMAVVLAWSLARLVMDGPVEIQQVPGLGAGSGGLHPAGSGSATGSAVPVLLRAAGGGAHVVVRDGDDRIAFSGDLAFGESRSLKVAPPIRVESSDGSVEIVVDGQDRGAVGDTGQPASGTYVAD